MPAPTKGAVHPGSEMTGQVITESRQPPQKSQVVTRDRYGRFVGASTAPKPPPARRSVLRDHHGRFVSTLPPLERGDEHGFVVRGLALRGEQARQRARLVQLRDGDPIAEVLA